MSVMFNDPWYHEMIAKNSAGREGSPDGAVVANAIMVAGAFIAQAIDGLSRGEAANYGGSIRSAIDSLAEAVDLVADRMPPAERRNEDA